MAHRPERTSPNGPFSAGPLAPCLLRRREVRWRVDILVDSRCFTAHFDYVVAFGRKKVARATICGERTQRGKMIGAEEHRVPPTPPLHGKHDRVVCAKGCNEGLDYECGDARHVAQTHEGRIGICHHRDASSDRRCHAAVKLGVVYEAHAPIDERAAHRFRLVARNHHNLRNRSPVERVDGMTNQCLPVQRKRELVLGSHAGRPTGREQQRSDAH